MRALCERMTCAAAMLRSLGPAMQPARFVSAPRPAVIAQTVGAGGSLNADAAQVCGHGRDCSQLKSPPRRFVPEGRQGR